MARLPRLAGVALLSIALGLTWGCGDSGSTGDNGSATSGSKNDTGNVQPTDDALDDPDTGADQPDAGGGDQPDSAVVEPDTAVIAPDAAADTVDGGTVQPDTGGGGGDCPGGDGCDCEKNDDCDKAVCIQTAEGKKCATPCIETCDKGWTCSNVGGSGSDTLFVCVPNFVTLCAPCEKSADCKLQGIESLCLDYGDKGHFCGGPCKTDVDCPEGYVCEDSEDGEGGKGKQCKMKDGEQCKCTGWAVAAATKMACKVTNAFGACSGTQYCTDKGMSACSGAEPAEETCDNLDNDCDGKTDVLPETAKCSLKSFFDVGSKKVCKVDADCTEAGEACDEQAGVCKKLIGECFGSPVCTVGGKTECTKVKTPKPEACNLEDDDCDGSTDEDFGWKNPLTGQTVAVGAGCGLGPCQGGVVKCASQIDAQCDSESKIAEDKCDGEDNDCDGKTDEAACDDGDACTTDACDGKSCSNTDGVNCDDSNQCTADSCDKGTGDCVHKALTGSCDDGDACTVGDVCGLADGATPTCVAGKDKKDCDDSNPCTDDACKADSGCVQLPNAVTQVCYSGEAKTEGVGLCKAGVQYCKDGKLEPQCVGEVAPNQSEICDNLDDNCDGQTDEGCKPAGVDVSFAAAFGTTAAGGKDLMIEVGGSAPAGTVSDDKKTGEFGFIAWILSLLE